MYDKFKKHLEETLQGIRDAGTYKQERLITSKQSSAITVRQEGKEIEALNFCANNYLGLADDHRLIEAAEKMMERRGFGMSSVRFICGTQDIHL